MSQIEARRTEVSFVQPSNTRALDIQQTVNTDEIVYQVSLQEDEDGRFVATCPRLPGVVTDGANEKEAMINARYAISDMLDSLGEPAKNFKMSAFILP